MKLKVSGGVPEGSYLAKFTKVEPTTNGFGPGLKWAWEITSGANTGQSVICTTSNSPSPKNRCGKILSGMLGKALNTGEEFDTSTLVGQNFLVIVRKSETGGTFVDSVTKAPVA
ncbi:hypothetical protein FTUN_0056 [Frigoriglobus tundricola]|uniref:Uncharacterized protein n=2 Tax=Frigoriglobus tundricola TaxID=2774151 RepID=A0A6M5YGV7_9BACT|nr:hypothetical protein FTUN_0056 [Frigoriglobus tundricola]